MGVELVDWLYPQDIFSSFVKDHVMRKFPENSFPMDPHTGCFWRDSPGMIGHDELAHGPGVSLSTEYRNPMRWRINYKFHDSIVKKT